MIKPIITKAQEVLENFTLTEKQHNELENFIITNQKLYPLLLIRGVFYGYNAREEETCEWKHMKDFFHNFYITGCCETQEFRNGIGENTYTYCPYCGGKIVEKEK